MLIIELNNYFFYLGIFMVFIMRDKGRLFIFVEWEIFFLVFFIKVCVCYFVCMCMIEFMGYLVFLLIIILLKNVLRVEILYI